MFGKVFHWLWLFGLLSLLVGCWGARSSTQLASPTPPPSQTRLIATPSVALPTLATHNYPAYSFPSHTPNTGQPGEHAWMPGRATNNMGYRD